MVSLAHFNWLVDPLMGGVAFQPNATFSMKVLPNPLLVEEELTLSTWSTLIYFVLYTVTL